MTVLIDTPRLKMRHFTLNDREAVYQFSTCEQTTRYTGDAGIVKTRTDAENVIRDVWLAEYKRYGYARYALVHKGDNKVIGFCGVKYEEELGGPDIGYRMLPEYWRQGLGTEAVTATIKHAQNTLKLSNIIGEVAVENIASSKILLNTGFQYVTSYIKQGFKLNRYELQLN